MYGMLVSSELNHTHTHTFISLTDFSKIPKYKFSAQSSTGGPVVPCGQTDGQTYMTKVMVAFPNYANTRKNGCNAHRAAET